jgi:hypothetical protein
MKANLLPFASGVKEETIKIVKEEYEVREPRALIF